MSSIPRPLEHRSSAAPGARAVGVAIALWSTVAVGCAGRSASSSAAARGATAELVVSAAGDLDLSPPAAGASAEDPLDDAAAALLPGRLRFVNLESPLIARGATTTEGAVVRLAAAPTRARLLAGRVDVVSLANNHALDWGERGREDTLRALAAVGVRGVVDGETADVGVLGGRPVRLVARFVPPGADLTREGAALVEAVRAAREGAAAVLVSLHWGRTGLLLPSEEQRALAARLVDAGAAAVLGHGPHTIQGVERRGRGLIAYSLGNLAFGCRCTDVGDAIALSFALAPDGSAGPATLRPFRAGLAGAPVALDADEGLYELVTSLASDLGTVLVRDGPRLRERR
jgi:poly-gamma-glutamate synthesis protein (capsule biosynthesis protein)